MLARTYKDIGKNDRLYFPDSDYKIYLQDLSEEMLVKGNPLNEELKQEVLSVDGVTDIIVARQSLHTSIKTDANQNSGICDTLTDQNYARGCIDRGNDADRFS